MALKSCRDEVACNWHEEVASEGTAVVERRTRAFSSFCRAALRTFLVREFWLEPKAVDLVICHRPLALSSAPLMRREQVVETIRVLKSLVAVPATLAD